MYEFPTNFDDTLFENQVRRELGLLEQEDTPQPTSRIQPHTERVSAFVEVEPDVGLDNETYRRVGAYPTAAHFKL